jgi:hypothetical protein
MENFIYQTKETLTLFWVALGWYCIIPPALVALCFYGAYRLEKKSVNSKRLACVLGFHKWDKYRGFDEVKPHHTARCYYCNERYTQ